MLRQVQLPMARRTIVVGINQCMMAALSMATIAALVNGPGLGKPVVAALQILNVGAASVAGLADRADGDHARPHHDRGQRAVRGTGRTNVGSASGPGVMLTGVVLERLPRWATEDAGSGQRLPRLTAAGRWLLRGCCSSRSSSASTSPASSSTSPSSRRRDDAGPEVHRRHRR